MSSFDGLQMNLGNLALLSDAETRSISAENPTGGKGMGVLFAKGKKIKSVPEAQLLEALLEAVAQAAAEKQDPAENRG